MIFFNELSSFFKNKKVLITGHTGFKGSWLVKILLNFDCSIMGVSKEVLPGNNLFDILSLKKKIRHEIMDLAGDVEKCQKKIINFQPDIIIHLAAQSLVIDSFIKPAETLKNNINSTINILEISRKINKLKFFFFVSTDKVYEIDNSNKKLSEKNHLGLIKDPYSLSKINSELIFHNYARMFFSKKNFHYAVARGGNVIGGGDFSKNRLIPDIFRSYKKKYFYLRNPKNIRPWQHVLDCLFGYLLILVRISRLNTPPSVFLKKKLNIYNVGPDYKNYLNTRQLSKVFIQQFDKSIKVFTKYKLRAERYLESKYLFLNSNKVKKFFFYKPLLNAKQTVKFTSDWYSCYLKNKKQIEKLTDVQIKFFFNNIKYK
jgi:CDP-glucose 4,6-dehydratase